VQRKRILFYDGQGARYRLKATEEGEEDLFSPELRAVKKGGKKK